jgi:hypothetical protein
MHKHGTTTHSTYTNGILNIIVVFSRWHYTRVSQIKTLNVFYLVIY